MISIKKILKQVEYESARRKKPVKKNHEKRGTNLNTPFFHINFSRELKGTQGNLSELI